MASHSKNFNIRHNDRQSVYEFLSSLSNIHNVSISESNVGEITNLTLTWDDKLETPLYTIEKTEVDGDETDQYYVTGITSEGMIYDEDSKKYLTTLLAHRKPFPPDVVGNVNIVESESSDVDNYIVSSIDSLGGFNLSAERKERMRGLGYGGRLDGETVTETLSGSITTSPPILNWGKAIQNWTNIADDGSYIIVNPCDYDGSNIDTLTIHQVYLPRLDSNNDPNLIIDNIIPYVKDYTLIYICIGKYLDGKIGQSIKLIDSGASTPTGWAILGIADKVIAFNVNPAQTGYDQHGTTENGHSNHGDHAHANHNFTNPTVLAHTVDGGGGSIHSINVVIPSEVIANVHDTVTPIDVGTHISPTVTSSMGHADHTMHTIPIVHDASTHTPHSDTSNWPPYGNIKLIVRSS